MAVAKTGMAGAGRRGGTKGRGFLYGGRSRGHLAREQGHSRGWDNVGRGGEGQDEAFKGEPEARSQSASDKVACCCHSSLWLLLKIWMSLMRGVTVMNQKFPLPSVMTKPPERTVVVKMRPTSSCFEPATEMVPWIVLSSFRRKDDKTAHNSLLDEESSHGNGKYNSPSVAAIKDSVLAYSESNC